MLDNKDLNDTCKSLLLLSLARSLPTRDVLASKIITLLDGDRPLLSRSAAAAAGDLALADPTELNQALWRRLKHGGDAATSGFVLLSLGKRADDANFKALLSHECLEATTRPYLAFALVEASQGSASRQAAATKRVRSLVAASRRNDGVGLAGACVALGLLGDSEAAGELALINQKHAMVTARSAAGLALGLLGRGQEASSLWRQEVRRASGFLVHDGALTMALSKTSKTAAELCQVMAARKDAYSLGGVAQAFGLLKSSESVPMLTRIIKDKKSPVEVRTFAIGALGLVLERNPGAWSRRLRSLAPIPVSSATISDVLSHL